MEMPSMPMLKSAWMDGIQAVCSTNCMSAVPVLNPVQSGMLRRNARMEMHRASHFAALSRLPEAEHDESADDGQPDQNREQVIVHGRQINHSRSEARPEDHGERIVIEIAGLRIAHDRAEPADQPRAAVDKGAVDHGLIAGVPERRADAARERHDDVLVEPVESVLVDQNRVQPLEAALGRIRPGRVLQKEQVRREHPGRGADKSPAR